MPTTSMPHLGALAASAPLVTLDAYWTSSSANPVEGDTSFPMAWTADPTKHGLMVHAGNTMVDATDEAIPALAESFGVSEDPTPLASKLRDGVKSKHANGVPADRQALRYEHALFTRLHQEAHGAREGYQAFIEGREPTWGEL